MSASEIFETSIGYKESEAYILENEGAYVLFINNNDVDSEYIVTALLHKLYQFDNNALPTLVSVSTENSKDLTVIQLKRAYNIERSPAFVYLESKNGKYEIKDTLTYYPNNPFSENDLKRWFFENDLWNAPYLTS